MIHHPRLRQSDKSTFDYVLYFFVFATPLFEIPQAVSIYSHHSASGVPLVTWAFFLMSSVTWLSYGLKRRWRPVILTYSLYLIIELIIVTGILRYS